LIGNLVENAVRHNIPGGWIKVRTTVEDGRGVLEVSSSGPVVDPDTVTHLFEPFRQGVRARTQRTGSGLGLSIVRAVVTAHRGTLTAGAVDGGGLAVRITIPVDLSRAAERPAGTRHRG